MQGVEGGRKSGIETALARPEIDMAPPASSPRTAAAPLPATRPARSPGMRVVRRQVEQILASPDFDGSRRSKEFLRFIVEEALAGRGE